MQGRSVTAAEAAQELGVTPACIRLWVRQGAPYVRLNRPLLVDVEALRAWRARGPSLPLADVAEGLAQMLVADAGAGCPAHVARRVPAPDAAVLYIGAYLRLHRMATGGDCEVLPDCLARLRLVAERKL